MGTLSSLLVVEMQPQEGIRLGKLADGFVQGSGLQGKEALPSGAAF